MKNKKRILLIASISVLILGGGGGYYAFANRSAAVATSSYLIGEAKIGDVTKTVTATGTLQNKNNVNMSFGTAGKLAALHAKVGDAVKKGQVLAELDKKVLQNQVDSARANLKSAQAKLDLLRQGPASADLASLQSQVTRAEVDLENAKRNLESARLNVDDSYLDSQVRIAADQMELAQNHYDTISKTGDALQIAMAKVQLDQANKNYSSAIAAKSNISEAQTQFQSAQNAVRTAQAAYDSAVIQLKSKQEPPTAADLAQAQATVEQAQASLSTAENNLAQATLTAPFNGVVTSVNVREGEQVGGTATVVSIQSTESALQLEVPIDEADIGAVKIGQKVAATADSIAGRRFDGSVEQIAPTGTTQNNVTTFSVTIAFTGNVSELKVGQSMTANILIEKRTGVITVPSEAIRGIGRQRSVQVLNSDKEPPVQVQVETGLDDGTAVEIKSGLTAGQKIVLGTRSKTGQNNAPANPFGGRQGGNLGGAGGGRNLNGGGGNR